LFQHSEALFQSMVFLFCVGVQKWLRSHHLEKTAKKIRWECLACVPSGTWRLPLRNPFWIGVIES
jgi:hypothetical protein